MSLLELGLQSQLSPCQSHSQRKMTTLSLRQRTGYSPGKRSEERWRAPRCWHVHIYTRQHDKTIIWPLLFLATSCVASIFSLFPSGYTKCQNCSAHLQLCQLLVKSIWAKTKNMNNIGHPHKSRSFYAGYNATNSRILLFS